MNTVFGSKYILIWYLFRYQKKINIWMINIAHVDILEARPNHGLASKPAETLPYPHIFLADCMPVPPFPEKHPDPRHHRLAGTQGEVA